MNPGAFNLGSPGNIKIGSLIEMSIGAAVGAITFSGSIIAFLKLQGIMSGSPITFKGQHPLNALILMSIVVLIYLLCASQSSNLFWILLFVSFLIGFLLIIPIGGANMPVVISMLNSYSGWAAANRIYTGKFSFNYNRSFSWIFWSNLVLHYVQRNDRSFLVSFSEDLVELTNLSSQNKEQRPVKSGNADDAAFLMKNASSVIIVPGYGMGCSSSACSERNG